MPELTGPQLFLRYAWPCVLSGARRISNGDRLLLASLFLENTQPCPTLLERCFPNAVANLIEFAANNNKSAWSLETVREFWLNHRGSGEICATKRGTVRAFHKLDGGTFVRVLVGSESILASVIYEPVMKLDKVTVHRNTVIEKLPE